MFPGQASQNPFGSPPAQTPGSSMSGTSSTAQPPQAASPLFSRTAAWPTTSVAEEQGLLAMPRRRKGKWFALFQVEKHGSLCHKLLQLQVRPRFNLHRHPDSQRRREASLGCRRYRQRRLRPRLQLRARRTRRFSCSFPASPSPRSSP